MVWNAKWVLNLKDFAHRILNDNRAQDKMSSLDTRVPDT